MRELSREAGKLTDTFYLLLLSNPRSKRLELFHSSASGNACLNELSCDGLEFIVETVFHMILLILIKNFDSPGPLSLPSILGNKTLLYASQ